MERPAPRPATICSRPAPASEPHGTDPLVPPPQLSAVYRFESLEHVEAVYGGERPGFIYARDGHPNAAQLAARVADLEGAEAAFVAASGMAALAAVLLDGLESGDHVVYAEQLYGRTITLIEHELRRFGVASTAFDAQNPESLEAALAGAERPRLVLVESLSNPLLRLPNLPRLAAIAHAASARLIVDHTFAPLLCRPLDLGADLVVHSATKLIGGHSDLTLGVIAGDRVTLERLAHRASTFGLSGHPFECWLAARGLATLALRVERVCATAIELARRLEAHPAVATVHYPGLPEHPDHKRALATFGERFGGIVTLDLGSRDRADRFIRRLEHIPFSPSLGDVATTLSHPESTSHRALDPETRQRLGITPRLIRLSIGLEDPEDLWNDLDAALSET